MSEALDVLLIKSFPPTWDSSFVTGYQRISRSTSRHSPRNAFKVVLNVRNSRVIQRDPHRDTEISTRDKYASQCCRSISHCSAIITRQLSRSDTRRCFIQRNFPLSNKN
ncbi:hypothetical protein L207DRAFT_128802 [Hyaloscypha variabilis F]|uniref:Uncharacterized protein n=1 Tax=Hyaloscypha variabilis (strain UAMH 11265 / GT02V1 / F) TaxID=1149755 RepID=A0A2J6R8R9_HYAVF|nr:hypothetical protein L207DRAFT_128802 [Hyaloscypha variabilis F]